MIANASVKKASMAVAQLLGFEAVAAPHGL